MTEFGEPEFTANAAAFDHRNVGTFKYSFNHQGFLLTLFKRFRIHEGSIDITRPVLREYDQQKQCFHIRDYDGLSSFVFGLWSND